jgi:hypothetical protein
VWLYIASAHRLVSRYQRCLSASSVLQVADISMLPRDSRNLSRDVATGQMRASCSVEAKLHISGRRFKVRRGTVTAGKGPGNPVATRLHVQLFSHVTQMPVGVTGTASRRQCPCRTPQKLSPQLFVRRGEHCPLSCSAMASNWCRITVRFVPCWPERTKHRTHCWLAHAGGPRQCRILDDTWTIER